MYFPANKSRDFHEYLSSRSKEKEKEDDLKSIVSVFLENKNNIWDDDDESIVYRLESDILWRLHKVA